MNMSTPSEKTERPGENDNIPSSPPFYEASSSPIRRNSGSAKNGAAERHPSYNEDSGSDEEITRGKECI